MNGRGRIAAAPEAQRPQPGRVPAGVTRALLAGAWLALAGGCATTGAGTAAGVGSAADVHRALLGKNPGVTALRALVEARVTYAGNAVSLPGALLLERAAGFRLDLLDPLDRPAGILFAEGAELIQYRPAANSAASLRPFPEECRGVRPADWVPVLLSSSAGPEAGTSEQLGSRPFGNSVLERFGTDGTRQIIWFRPAGEELLPTKVSWHCGDETLLELRVRSWLAGSPVRFPARLEVSYPLAGYQLRLDVKEIQANPPPAGDLLPRIGPDVRWWVWRLPG